MKKLLLAALLFCGVSSAQAIEPNSVNRSSAIVAAAGTGYIASLYLDKVVVGAASAGGVLELYNSTFTTSVLISSISLATVRYVDFSNLQVNGIYWRTSTNLSGVTIIYKK